MRKRERAFGRGFRNAITVRSVGEFEIWREILLCRYLICILLPRVNQCGLPLRRLSVYIDSIQFDMLSVREEALCVRQGLSVPVQRSQKSETDERYH
jgi:hypothetical protein